jgi:hypothetical protein
VFLGMWLSCASWTRYYLERDGRKSSELRTTLLQQQQFLSNHEQSIHFFSGVGIPSLTLY